MKRLDVVTGAAGLVGFDLCRELLEQGSSVLAVDRFDKGGRGDLEALRVRFADRLEILETDLARDTGRLAAAWTKEARAVFHLAAIVGVRAVEADPYATLDVNLRSTLAVLDLARARGCARFFFASSSENYAAGVARGAVPVPTPEDVLLGIDDPSLPRWSYAASKIAGEAAVFAAARGVGFAPLVGRFHNVYGPRMRPTHVVPELLERCARRDDPFPLWGAEQTRSFLHVRDAVRAVTLLAERGPAGVYNVGSAVETPIEELARLCFEVSGHRPAAIERRPAPAGSVARRVPVVARLERLGFAPAIGLAAGVGECWRTLTRA